MSDRMKEKLGEELYKQILDKGLKSTEFDLIDNHIPKARFNEINEKLKVTNGKIESYEKQLNETKELLKGSEEFKSKYEELTVKYKTDLELKDKEIINTTKRGIIENQLIKEGVKHTDLLLPKIDLDSLSIENGNILGLNDTMKGLKEKYSDLFVTKNTTSNNSGSSNNNNTGSSNEGEEDWSFITKF